MARKQKIGLITTGGTIAMALAGDSIENEINFTFPSSPLSSPCAARRRPYCSPAGRALRFPPRAVRPLSCFEVCGILNLKNYIKKLYEIVLNLSKTVDEETFSNYCGYEGFNS